MTDADRPETHGTDEQPADPRHRRPALIVGLVVVAIAAVIAVTIRFSADEKPRGPAATDRPTTTAAPRGAAAELVGLLDAGTKLAFDGRFTVSAEGGPTGTLRLWSRPPLRRVDTESGAGAELRRTAQFSLPAGTAACVRQASDGAWGCTARPGLDIGSGLLPETFVSQLPRFSVVARDDRVGERNARCFSLTGADLPSGDVCLNSDGIPLRVQAGSVTAELTELDRTPPPAEIFELPAPLS